MESLPPEIRTAGQRSAWWCGEPEVERLANGLTVCVLADRSRPLVGLALCYLAGTRDELPGQGGLAHFLEHMMFKGSPRFGAGEVDRITEALGGANHAFTSHDATLYQFDFAADRWLRGLDMEADRMDRLTLHPEEIGTERGVIREEIDLAEDEPWDALETRVRAALYRGHPYGLPILGTRETLDRIGRPELALFHRRLYRPGNAVLALAGDVGGNAVEEVRDRFGPLAGGPAIDRALPAPTPPGSWERVEIRRGELPRALLALPAPGAADDGYVPLRLALAILGGGRASRLHRRLVDERGLCLSVAAEVSESVGPAMATIAADLAPEARPEIVEDELRRALERLAAGPITGVELARARQLLLADWVFGHQRARHVAATAALSVALFDSGWPDAQLRRLAECEPEEVGAAAQSTLSGLGGGVVGWALPRGGARR